MWGWSLHRDSTRARLILIAPRLDCDENGSARRVPKLEIRSVACRLSIVRDETPPGSVNQPLGSDLLVPNFFEKLYTIYPKVQPASSPSVNDATEAITQCVCTKTYGMPKTGAVTCTDGGSLGPRVPDYLVWSASFPASGLNLEDSSVKLIDFGESFFPYEKPKALHTPLALRAPEILFDEVYDFRVDRWGFACAMFELIVDYPPFTGIMAKKEDILQQIADMIGEPPAKWQPKWKAMPKWDQVYDDDPVYNLEQWLDLTYFDGSKRLDFTTEDIKQVGRMIRGLLQWCPPDRSSVAEVVSNGWFQDG
ncbi:kinase-like protein, partial [Aureobasidium melanogenum]